MVNTANGHFPFNMKLIPQEQPRLSFWNRVKRLGVENHKIILTSFYNEDRVVPISFEDICDVKGSVRHNRITSVVGAVRHKIKVRCPRNRYAE